MKNLQSLIKDIIVGAPFHLSVTIWFSEVTTRDSVEVSPSSTGSTHINLHIEDGVYISVHHKKNTSVSFNMPMEKLGYDFTEAIDKATRLWNEYKSNNQ